MSTPTHLRVIFLFVFVLSIASASMAVWRFSFIQALDQVAQKGQADLALASDRLIAQLRRYQELVVLTADHPDLTALVNQRPTLEAQDRAQNLLLSAADKTAAVSLFYVTRKGDVIASANTDLPDGIETSAYFERALDGALGVAHDYSTKLDKRLFYFASPSFGSDRRVQAVLVVAVDVERIEAEWRGGQQTVFFVDDVKTVFISNRSELLFWTRPEGEVGLVPNEGGRKKFEVQTIRDREIWYVDWGDYVPRDALHLTVDLPSFQLFGEALVDLTQARRLAWLQALVVAAIFTVLGAVALLTFERRRALASANAELERKVKTRTNELSRTNEQLRSEIVERQEAEAALKRAQADLVQAGKLSALGQMSAGISHELNQPLMVIQQYAENGSKLLEKGKPETAQSNLTQISAMAARMSRIIKNLRAFARNESEPMGKVDAVQVVETALELTQPYLKRSDVSVTWNKPNTPIFVHAGEVRLGQVLINLVTNAVDAMAQSPERGLHISIETGARVAISVADTGPGIDQPEKIFEPFYTTKQIGSSEGMGLGLSISYGLIQSFGGNIIGENTPTGAKFTVELDLWGQKGKGT